MGDFLEGHWWLLFPLAFFIAAGFSSYMRFKRTQAKIELLKTYAAAGKEPPAELLASLDVNNAADNPEGGESSDGRGTTTFLVILFVGLASIFVVVGYLGLLGLGAEAYIVSAVLGVLALAFLFSGIAGGRRRD